MEYQKNVPHDRRFETVPRYDCTQKFVYKNILLDKMTARNFNNVSKGKTKTSNLDYHPNHNFIKAKNSYGPVFGHYMDTKRNGGSILDGGKMMYGEQYSCPATQVDSKIVTNFDKMIGRDELKGGFADTFSIMGGVGGGSLSQRNTSPGSSVMDGLKNRSHKT